MGGNKQTKILTEKTPKNQMYFWIFVGATAPSYGTVSGGLTLQQAAFSKGKHAVGADYKVVEQPHID
jgi:hypothetical protein